MPETIAHSRFADLYDSYVRVTQDIPFFLYAARQIDGGVLELMCGTGRVSLPLVEAGVRLTCVDYSADMLAVLRRKLAAHHLRAELVCPVSASCTLTGSTRSLSSPSNPSPSCSPAPTSARRSAVSLLTWRPVVVLSAPCIILPCAWQRWMASRACGNETRNRTPPS